MSKKEGASDGFFVTGTLLWPSRLAILCGLTAFLGMILELAFGMFMSGVALTFGGGYGVSIGIYLGVLVSALLLLVCEVRFKTECGSSRDQDGVLSGVALFRMFVLLFLAGGFIQEVVLQHGPQALLSALNLFGSCTRALIWFATSCGFIALGRRWKRESLRRAIPGVPEDNDSSDSRLP